MAYHEHRLDAAHHAAFLAEGRSDLYTNTPFRPGAVVVGCAECGTVFLRDSWRLMGGRHCGQDETLAALPGARPPSRPIPLPAPAWQPTPAWSPAPPMGPPPPARPVAEPRPAFAAAPAPYAAGPAWDGFPPSYGPADDGGRMPWHLLAVAFLLGAGLVGGALLLWPEGRRDDATDAMSELAAYGGGYAAEPDPSVIDVAAPTDSFGAADPAAAPGAALQAGGQSVPGVLGGLGAAARGGYYEATHPFQAGAGESVTLRVVAAFEPRLRVSGPAGPLTVEAERGSERGYDALTARFRAPASGAYTVVLTSAAPEEMGPYDLSLRTAALGRSAAPPEEPARAVEVQPRPPAEVAPAPARAERPAVASAPRTEAPPEGRAGRLRRTPGAEPSPPAPAPAAPREASPAAPPAARGGVSYALEGLGRRPTLAPLPENPGATATGTYRLVVGSDGRVIDVFVSEPSGQPVLDAQALRTLRRWQFEAATPDARPSVGSVVLRFRAR